MPPTPPHKTVTFCTHCNYDKKTQTVSDKDLRYYSDPERIKNAQKQRSESIDSDIKYYSEPDAKNYFEIDYQFLKELRKIAKSNCPKCRRKRKIADKTQPKKTKSRYARPKETFVFCHGKYHSNQEHCPLCCKICNKSTDTLDSIDDDHPHTSRSHPSSRITSSSRSKSSRERRNSIQSNKSVSFLESSNDESMKDETNYTAKSFTNDLKKFLLKPSPPRLSLRDKFIISFKQEFEATKRSPKLKAIKGFWKSY